jgi:hypothetical protein
MLIERQEQYIRLTLDDHSTSPSTGLTRHLNNLQVDKPLKKTDIQ